MVINFYQDLYCEDQLMRNDFEWNDCEELDVLGIKKYFSVTPLNMRTSTAAAIKVAAASIMVLAAA